MFVGIGVWQDHDLHCHHTRNKIILKLTRVTHSLHAHSPETLDRRSISHMCSAPAFPQAFENALRLQPEDYSLWNKLGATLANHARSADAIYAYQKVRIKRRTPFVCNVPPSESVPSMLIEGEP